MQAAQPKAMCIQIVQQAWPQECPGHKTNSTSPLHTSEHVYGAGLDQHGSGNGADPREIDCSF